MGEVDEKSTFEEGIIFFTTTSLKMYYVGVVGIIGGGISMGLYSMHLTCGMDRYSLFKYVLAKTLIYTLLFWIIYYLGIIVFCLIHGDFTSFSELVSFIQPNFLSFILLACIATYIGLIFKNQTVALVLAWFIIYDFEIGIANRLTERLHPFFLFLFPHKLSQSIINLYGINFLGMYQVDESIIPYYQRIIASCFYVGLFLRLSYRRLQKIQFVL